MASDLIKHVTDATFEADVLKATQPILVDYWAEWCGPCKMIAPILDDVSAAYEGKLQIAKMNVDENRDIPAKFGIRGIPTLMEKPIADSVEEARHLCAAAAAAQVPLLVGHQRRHNPIVRKAKQLVEDGVLGRPVSATALSTWLKPDPYFNTTWRREPGGGPILINLIHDIDLMRHLLGDIVGVQAMTSNRVRGFAVEDTAAVLLQFANGALGTISVSDTVVAPWNYDLASGEQAHYPRQDIDSHFLCGTEGSLTLPRLEVWRYHGARGWHDALSVERTPVHTGNPYTLQLRHLRAVAEGEEAPLCSGIDGLKTLEATRAVLTAGATGQLVQLPT